MHYIVFDLEFNQGFSFRSVDETLAPLPKNLFEIIQIGSVKLDSDLRKVESFSRFVRPVVFTELNPFVAELTGITAEQLMSGESFSDVYGEFAGYVERDEAVLCVWGLTDMRELFKNAEYHHLDTSLLPRRFIDVQLYVSRHLNLSAKRRLRLEAAVERFGIPKTCSFHDALHDADYTAEVFKMIYASSIKPEIYDPTRISIKTGRRPAKKVVDFDALLGQFEKMYARELSEEERGMVKLAYRMGRTGQFVE